MSSQWKQEPNRCNARSSSRPGIVAGKEKSNRSAVKHGLATPVLQQPYLVQEVQVHASAISAELEGTQTPVDLLALSASEIDLERIRAARAVLLIRIRYALNGQDCHPSGQPPVEDSISDAVRQLHALDGYERRALTRQKAAVRQLTRRVLERA